MKTSVKRQIGTKKPFIMQDYFRFKNGPFCLCCLWLHFTTSLYECSLSCAAMAKHVHFIYFRMIRRPHPAQVSPHLILPGNTNTMYSYQVIPVHSSSTAAVVFTADTTPIVLEQRKRWRRYNRATATIAQHVPPLRAQLAGAVSTPSERRRHTDSKPTGLVEIIVSAL